MNKTNKAKRPETRKWQGNQFQNTLRQLLYPKPFRIGLVPGVPLERAKPDCNAMPIESSAATAAEQILAPDIQKLIVQLATNLWRINNKVGSIDEPDKNTRSVQRHTQASLDVLMNGKIEIKDHTNQKYIPGMALDVLTFQPDPSAQDEIISETIKPSIYYQDVLIQRGEVVVLMPKKEGD